MTDKTDLIREIHEYVTTHGGENTATHLLVQAASAIQAQAAELEAVGAGGVQALSAAPAEQSQPRYSHLHDADAVHGKRLSVYSKPPAEQRATTTEAVTPKGDATTGAALGGVHAELPEPNLPRGGFPDLFTERQMRDFADRTHALRMQQAAPKAAPGEPIAWTPGPNLFKDWCAQWFGPDSDDDYLAKAVFNLPPMAQVFKEAAPQPAPAPLIARSLAEWHEDDGCVAWWAWNGREWAGEPAWIGNPNCEDWPGYHTHWTPHPDQPVFSALAAQERQP